MKAALSTLFALALIGLAAAPALAQEGGPRPRRVVPVGPLDTATYHTRFIRLSQDSGALLYEPNDPGPKARVALVLSHPNANNFADQVGRTMAARGYRVMLVDHHGADLAPEAVLEAYLPSISRSIGYLRTLPGVQKVVVIGHSGGGALTALYGNVAQNGPAGCQRPEVIYKCKGEGLAGLQKADGLIIQDAPVGAFHRMSGTDPAVGDSGRNAALDMLAPANGYNPATKTATYSPAFIKAYYAAQRVRYEGLVKQAQARLTAIEQGKSYFEDNEPFLVRGMGPNANGARLYGTDLRLATRTKKPVLILRGDGTEVMGIAQSIRPTEGNEITNGIRKLNTMNLNTTVRHFMATFAMRIGPDYAITENDIVGVDWRSAYNSPPANAEGIVVPALVMAGSCHYLIVPDEIVYEHLASKDKTYAVVEGATHGFGPCRPEFGDVEKRTYDFIDRWLSKDGRF